MSVAESDKMMMRHSRWSGRRIMPSGGGWMTPNPSGGVAACLVWNKDGRRQSDELGATDGVTLCDTADNEPQGWPVNPPTDRDLNVRMHAMCNLPKSYTNHVEIFTRSSSSNSEI